MANFHKKPSLRRSQAITTFGPGAIVDLRDTSAMMLGVNFWKENHHIVIHEPNLERALKVKEFRMPTTADQSNDGDDLPAIVFPRWHVCPKCHRLAPYDHFAGGMHRHGREIRCPDCRVRVYPARLIVACQHGHIDDFPWIRWAHDRGQSEVCDRPALFLRARGFSSSLMDIEINCKNCDSPARSLIGATEERNLRFHRCNGKRPWLLDRENCGENVRPLQRGASNVYFPVQVSSLSIPPWSRSVYARLNPHWSIFRYIPDEALAATIIGLNLPENLNMTENEIVQAIKQRRHQEQADEAPFSERDIRFQECLAIQKGSSDDDIYADFKTQEAQIPFDLKGIVNRVVLVERLREVRAMIGFTRIDPPDPISQNRTSLVPISRYHNPDWYPSIEVRGEGIYLELNENGVSDWIKQYSQVRRRAEKLHEAYKAMCERKDWQVSRNITPRFVLAHALAHALIRQLSLESGYSAASLRERLYAFEPDEMDHNPGITGLMIYTSTPDSEGSLGGLVRQGKPDRSGNLMRSALESAAWCSSDPLCIESDGQGNDGTNLAACHSCMLLPETCCEEFNRFLDRSMLIGTIENPDSGFFSQYLET